MPRERNGTFADLVSVVRQDEVARGTIDLLMVMHEDPIVHDGHVGRTQAEETSMAVDARFRVGFAEPSRGRTW